MNNLNELKLPIARGCTQTGVVCTRAHLQCNVFHHPVDIFTFDDEERQSLHEWWWWMSSPARFRVLKQATRNHWRLLRWYRIYDKRNSQTWHICSTGRSCIISSITRKHVCFAASKQKLGDVKHQHHWNKAHKERQLWTVDSLSRVLPQTHQPSCEVIIHSWPMVFFLSSSFFRLPLSLCI